MTRRRILLALLALTAAVAVLIPVLMRSRGADVEIKFVGYETNGAARLRVINRSSAEIVVGKMITFEPDGNRAFHNAALQKTAATMPGATLFAAVRPGREMRFDILPPPRAPWHAQVEYAVTRGFSWRVRELLSRLRLATRRPLPILNATSATFTNAPPIP
jgi:hypothetical protein